MACWTRSANSRLLAALLCALAMPALGDKLAEAKVAAGAGKQAFDLGKFELALKKYEEAYTLHSAPGLLFNIGQCHRQMGNIERSLFFFKRFLESKPTGPQAKSTQELIARLEEVVAAQKARDEALASSDRQLALERARADAAKAEAEAANARRAAELAEAEAQRLSLAEAALKQRLAVSGGPGLPDPDAAVKAGPPPAPLVKQWWFWTAIGATVAAGVATAVVVGTPPKPTPTTFPDINAR